MINDENEKEMDNSEKILDLNDLFKRTYEFDIFKYVSRGLIKSQQNYEISLNELKLENSKIKEEISLLKSEINEIKANTTNQIHENKNRQNSIETNIQNINLEIDNKKQNNKNLRKTKSDNGGYTNINLSNDTLSNKNKIMQKTDILDINKDINEKDTENTHESLIKLSNTFINEIVNQNNIKKEEIDNNRKEKMTNQNDIDINSINNEFINIKSKLDEMDKELNQFKLITNQAISESNNNIKTNISDNIIKLKEESKLELNSLNENINQKIVLLNDTTKNLTEKNIENEKLMNKTNAFINKFVQLKTIYLSYDDFEKYKHEIFEKIDTETRERNIDISMIKNSIISIKNDLVNITNDTTLNDNILKLKQKQDTTLSLVEKIQDIQKEMKQNEKKHNILIDTSQFLNIDIFNEFQKSQMKIIEKMKRDFTDLDRELNEIKMVDLSNKTSLKDLKNLEDIVLNKMEDLLNYIKLKYIEKKDLEKFTKLIDYQTKQTLEEFKLNLKPGKNWLLAKKSLGHLCASCESFIGENLQTPPEKNIIWNRIASKASGDNKNIKIGMGYSKIIQMSNENEKEKEKILSFSLDKNNIFNARHNSLNNKKENNANEELSNNNMSNTSSKLNKLNFENNNSFQTEEYETEILNGSLPQIRKKTINYSSMEDKQIIKHCIKSLKDIKKSQNIIDKSDYIIKTTSQRRRNEINEISFGPKITKIFKKFNNSKNSEQLNNDSKKNSE